MTTPNFQVGAFVSPLTAATTRPLLQDADPALWALVAFYASVLSTHLGARFDAEVTAAGFPELVGRVASPALPYDPLPHLAVSQVSPPLLAVYPVEEDFSERTRHRYHGVERWKVLWVLPPLTPAQHYRLSPFLRAVTKVLVDRTEQGADPAHLGGALVCELGGIESIKVARARYGTVQGLRTELYLPAVDIDLEVAERTEATPGLQQLTGFAGSVETTDFQGANPTTIAEFAEDLS